MTTVDACQGFRYRVSVSDSGVPISLQVELLYASGPQVVEVRSGQAVDGAPDPQGPRRMLVHLRKGLRTRFPQLPESKRQACVAGALSALEVEVDMIRRIRRLGELCAP